MPGRVGAWEGGVHKGVSEGVIEWVAWFGGLSVCSLVSKRYVHGFFLHPFLLHAFFSMGFSPWVLGGGPRTW